MSITAKLKKRIKREIFIRELKKKNYMRLTAARWFEMVRKDNLNCPEEISSEDLKKAHSLGYLSKSIMSLGMDAIKKQSRISDLDYLSLRPMNNSFSKWIEDVNTMTRILPGYAHRLPKIIYSISVRNGLKVLDYPSAERELTVDDIVETIKQADGLLQLRPAFWNSDNATFNMGYYDENVLTMDDSYISHAALERLLLARKTNYLLTEYVPYDYQLTEEWNKKAYYKFYIVSEGDNSARIASAAAFVLDPEAEEPVYAQYHIDLAAGKFVYEDGAEYAIPNFDVIKEDLIGMANCIPQIRYFSVNVAVTEDGFKIVSTSYEPELPMTSIDDDLNEYLKNWAAFRKTQKDAPAFTPEKFRYKRFVEHVKRDCRPGMRPYMQKTWENALKSDRKWKGTTKEQKLWAWERGFLSFRIGQYNLTEDNYRNMLSDYDYHWLNRVNNIYQIWINDKTTFRYSMEPLKKFIPDYYFSVYKRDDETMVSRMQDCPEEIGNGFEGILDVIRRDAIVVFKPSAGFHGDGFYCLEYREDKYWINGEATDAKGIEDLIRAQKNNYVVTSYIIMNSKLKEIYPKSVNSIRVMVINRFGYEPKIMQTYLRIGSSRTGYTDNVGYGGICAMIDTETGKLYNPETLVDHIYYPCPNHPDTGTLIEGIEIPHWEYIKENVVRISRLFPELEYLGFDVAVTEDGFNIMEINVHQDLHKVALHSDEVRAYYQERIEYKKKMYNIKKLKYWY